jgi:aspartate ammonia-lyase
MNKENNFYIDCQGGDGILKFLYDDDKHWEDVLFLEYFHLSFYEKQTGVLDIIWTRLKNAILMLRGKEFLAYEVVLNRDQLKDFKNWVNSL